MVKTYLSGILFATTLVLSACWIGQKTHDHQGEPSGGGGAGASNGGTPGAFSTPCESNTACSSNLCMSEREHGWPGGFCSASCDPKAGSCEGKGKCLDIGQPKGVCLVPCKQGDDACRTGYECTDLKGDGSFYACLPACTEDAQCPVIGTCSPTTRLCVTAETDCNNATDDDADGLVDCEDPTGCKGTSACAPGSADTGHPCAAASDCRAYAGEPSCFSEAATGYPRGYCSEFCRFPESHCATAGAVCLDYNLQSGHGLCMLSCQSDAECPTAGYKCAPAPSGTKVCQPGCTADDQCSSHCNKDTGLCAKAQ
jgi:hypothetical protein